MEILESKVNDILVFEFSGRLDAITAKDADKALINKIDSGNLKLVADLAKLEYISSAGLRVFLSIAKKLGKTGFIRLSSLLPQVKEVFEMSGFNSIFKIYPTKEDAVKE